MDETRSTSTAGRRSGPSKDQLRLMARVALMYHERGMKQSEIAAELHVSQPRVSRLLKLAAKVGIVRTTVALPAGVHAVMEEALEERYGLSEAVVVDAPDREEDVVVALGAATAGYLEATLTGDDTVGISSWSSTLLAAVEALRPFRSTVVDQVVQLVGGVGDPRVQVLATRLIGQFAEATGASPVFVPAPGMLGSASARDTLIADATVAEVMELWPSLTQVLVGIGSLEPSPLLQQSGNAIPEPDQEQLRREGAVGDICLRFFDSAGVPVRTTVDERVIGIDFEQLRQVPRRIGVAGGERKQTAIRAALLGGWLTVLVTDTATARYLLDHRGTA